MQPQTAELPREEQVDQEVTERVYVSHIPNLRLTVVAADDVPIGDYKGTTRRVPGEHIVFEQGRFATTSARYVEFLDNHVNKDKLFRDITGQLPKPDSAPVLERLIELTGRREVEEIADILVAERKGHQRTEVLLAAEKALNVLGEEVEPSTPPVNAGKSVVNSGPMNLAAQRAEVGAAERERERAASGQPHQED